MDIFHHYKSNPYMVHQKVDRYHDHILFVFRLTL